MSEEQTVEAQEPTQAATEAPQSDTETQDRSPNAEAAKWRTKLRETEAERDGLRQRVEAYQRADVERIAGETLKQGGDLFAFGVSINDVLDDNGQVDPDVVTAKSEELLKDKPYMAKRLFGDVDLGPRGHAPRQPSWSDALRGGK